MTQKWTQKGAIAPLFDRLCDYEPTVNQELVPFVTYTKKQLLESIQFEIANLLNTRSGISLADYISLDPEKLPYGVPDLFGLPDSSFADLSSKSGTIRLSKMLENSIRVFEPRLTNIQVQVSLLDPKTQSAQASVVADLILDDVRETISFPVSVHNFQDVANREDQEYDTSAKFDWSDSSKLKDATS